MNITILLLQSREVDDPARVEERESFARMAGVTVEQMVPFDLLQSTPTLAQIRQHDALMIGGSGDYYVSKGNLPNFAGILDVLAEVAEVGHPTFASCFGFQLMTQALGGRIIYDPDHMEVGTYDLTLSEAAQKDDLFSYLPPQFRAQLGRKDRAERLPTSFISLASSEAIPYQAFRLPGKPIWGTQFHPELTKETNLFRFRRYLDGYQSVLAPEAIQTTLDRFDHSPEANELIARFVKLVFG